MNAIRAELARRIVWEAEAVNARFPGRFRLARDANGLLFWEGAVPVEDGDFPVRVTYPAAYPALPPTLETTADLATGCPHLLRRIGPRATLCWVAPYHRVTRRRWDPQRHTAATVLRAAQRWALAYLVWQQLGVWPVADAWEA
jgi:hypothetical protein